VAHTYPAPHPFCWASADCQAHPVAALLSPSSDGKAVYTTLVCYPHAQQYLVAMAAEGAEPIRLRSLTPDERTAIKAYEETK
jgi:hypothetical protein